MRLPTADEAMAYYYTRDHLGSVREVLDSTGTLQARYNYNPYGSPPPGQTTNLVSGTNLATFQYAGAYFHSASSLNLTMYRAYASITGRWLSRDPIQEQGGINLYNYTGEDPIDEEDPLGLATITITIYFAPNDTIQDHAGAQRQIAQLRNNLAKCKKYNIILDLNVVDGGTAGNGYPNFPPKGANPVLFAPVAPGVGGITNQGRSIVNPESRNLNTLSHELGHQGNYYNPADPGPTVNPDGSLNWNKTNPIHSGDPNSLMYPKGGKDIDKCWCEAMQRLAK